MAFSFSPTPQQQHQQQDPSSPPPPTPWILQVPLHVLGLILRELDTLPSLGAAILAHPVLHAAFAEDPSRIVRDLLDAQMSQPYAARLAYAAHVAHSVERKTTFALKSFASEWLKKQADEPEAAEPVTKKKARKLSVLCPHEGPFAIWPWGLSLADVVQMSKMHGIVEHLTDALMDSPASASIFGPQALVTAASDSSSATVTTVAATAKDKQNTRARIHRFLYGYHIHCRLLFRDADDWEMSTDETMMSVWPTMSPTATSKSRTTVYIPLWRIKLTSDLKDSLYDSEDDANRTKQQLICMYNFLEEIIMKAFKQIALHEISWGAHRVDYLSPSNENEHIQAYLSFGLEYIYKLHQASTAVDNTVAAAHTTSHFSNLCRLHSLFHHHPFTRYSAACVAPFLPPKVPYMISMDFEARFSHTRTFRPFIVSDVSGELEVVACDKELEEREKRQKQLRPLMRASWVRRQAMYRQGHRGLLLD